MKEAELLNRMEADENGRPAEGLCAWVCRRCSKKAAVSHSLKPCSSTEFQLQSASLCERFQPTTLVIEPTTEPTREFLVPALAKASKPQVAARDIDQDRSSRATPHIDLLAPPVLRKRVTKVTTSHQRNQNVPAATIYSAPTKNVLPGPPEKDESTAVSSPEVCREI